MVHRRQIGCANHLLRLLLLRHRYGLPIPQVHQMNRSSHREIKKKTRRAKPAMEMAQPITPRTSSVLSVHISVASVDVAFVHHTNPASKRIPRGLHEFRAWKLTAVTIAWSRKEVLQKIRR